MHVSAEYWVKPNVGFGFLLEGLIKIPEGPNLIKEGCKGCLIKKRKVNQFSNTSFALTKIGSLPVPSLEVIVF